MTSQMMLALSGIAYGVFVALVFRRTTDPRELRRTLNKLLARILEFRLFLDEPGLIWRAQIGAVGANLQLLRQTLLAGAVSLVIFAVAWVPLDRYLSYEPLRSGETAVITAKQDRKPEIPGAAFETPGVRVERTGEVSWRIRAIREVPDGRRDTSWPVRFFSFAAGANLLAFLLPSIRRYRWSAVSQNHPPLRHQ